MLCRRPAVKTNIVPNPSEIEVRIPIKKTLLSWLFKSCGAPSVPIPVNGTGASGRDVRAKKDGC
jgi:hypothetical protein